MAGWLVGVKCRRVGEGVARETTLTSQIVTANRDESSVQMGKFLLMSSKSGVLGAPVDGDSDVDRPSTRRSASKHDDVFHQRTLSLLPVFRDYLFCHR